MLRIKILRDKIAFEGKFIRLRQRYFRGISGKTEVWEMIERKTYGSIVAVIAITPKKEIILTKTYRIPIKSYVLEFPAGLNDKKGESESAIARRELLEETGYTARRFKKLAGGVFNAGLTTDHLVLYLAKDARYVRKPHHDNAEEMETVKVPLGRLLYLLNHPPKNTLVDLKLFSVPTLLKEIVKVLRRP